MGRPTELTMMLLLVAVANAACTLNGCSSCSTTLTNGAFVETCYSCGTGFSLSAGKCDIDVGLLVGISLGSVGFVAAMIACFCFCNNYFKKANKKPTEFNLKQILKVFEEDRKDPLARQQLEKANADFLKNKVECDYCVRYPEDALEFDKEVLKWALKKQEINRKSSGRQRANEQHLSSKQSGNSGEIIQQQQQEEEYTGPPNPTGPNIKVNCSQQHYFHLPCLKKLLYKKEKKCVCGQENIGPFKITCVDCRLKNRILKFDISQDKNIAEIKEYVCSLCYKKRRELEQENKWWKKFC